MFVLGGVAQFSVLPDAFFLQQKLPCNVEICRSGCGDAFCHR